jgi:hypothetical protein
LTGAIFSSASFDPVCDEQARRNQVCVVVDNVVFRPLAALFWCQGRSFRFVVPYHAPIVTLRGNTGRAMNGASRRRLRKQPISRRAVNALARPYLKGISTSA